VSARVLQRRGFPLILYAPRNLSIGALSAIPIREMAAKECAGLLVAARIRTWVAASGLKW
jgi:hypothetical protein